MTDRKELSETDKAKLKKIIDMFREIINMEGAIENGFYLDTLSPEVLDLIRGWLKVRLETFLEPEEAVRLRLLREALKEPVEILIEVSQRSASIEEYSKILLEEFRFQLADLTKIHRLAYDLLSRLSYEKKRIEQTISIILTTISQWDDGVMEIHKELLRVFRPDNQTIIHSEIISMRLDKDNARTFACYYPWGGNYAQSLQEFLTDNGIEWCEDPRTSGGDCYGMLIAGKSGNIEAAVERINNIGESCKDQFHYDTEDFDEEGYWEAVCEARWNLDLSNLGVVDISTDWKHLETYDHAEALLKIGIQMTQIRSEELGLELFTLEIV